MHNATRQSLLQIVVVCDEASGKNKKVLPPSKNGGLTNIQATLSSDIRVLHDIAAGSSFREALFHKTDDKVQLDHCACMFNTALFI